MADFKKFIRFFKVDSVAREVSGIVTAERPDKDLEVCDYEKSKPFYQKWSEEFRKATDGASLGNLREMHGLVAAGKATGLEFNDAEKSIVMTFKVVDEDAWKKVEERVYTGFSQGGRKVGEMSRDPVFKNCMRYVANPSEVSLVDNPCLPDAHFAYVKADGSVEMRKFLNVELPDDARIKQAEETIASLQTEVSLLKMAAPTGAVAAAGAAITVAVAAEAAKAKTKRVGGKDLEAANFAYVFAAEQPETWKFPIHDAPHVRHSLAQLGHAKDIPDSAKAKIRTKVLAAARKCGVDVALESQKAAAVLSEIRKAVRIYVNENCEKISSPSLLKADAELGKMLHGGMLTKGLWHVSRLACSLEDIACLLSSVVWEQEWEPDEDSKLPEMLRENVTALAATLVTMVNEETEELLEQIRAKT